MLAAEMDGTDKSTTGKRYDRNSIKADLLTEVRKIFGSYPEF